MSLSITEQEWIERAAKKYMSLGAMVLDESAEDGKRDATLDECKEFATDLFNCTPTEEIDDNPEESASIDYSYWGD